MKWRLIETSELSTNTYVCTDGQRALVIDPGFSGGRVEKMLAEEGAKCTHVLLTHGHFDHTGGVASLQAAGAKVYLHTLDAKMAGGTDCLDGLYGSRLVPFRVDKKLCHGEKIKFGRLTFIVLHTPGHTAGSVCFATEETIFSGDTLFFESAGRTDFPGGSLAALKASVATLCSFRKDYAVYPGHGRETTLAWENTHNPFSFFDQT